MEIQNSKSGEHGITIDLHSGEIEVMRIEDLPRSWPFGQFVSHRTGTFKEMDSLRRSIISNNLKTLMRHG